MKNEGLLSTPRPLLSASLSGILIAVGIAAGLFAAGFLTGNKQTRQPDPVAAPNVKKPLFALLVHNDDTPPVDPTRQFREYGDWVRNLKAERFADGEALHGKAWVLRPAAGEQQRALAVDLRENREAVSGYFIFEASGSEEALKVAQSCPHLKYGGTLELREIYR